MSRLSLCLIVKDEEANLAQCLDSVRGHVDEIIVVDTGSTDKTREVAVRFGANVHQYDHYNHPESFFIDSEEECSKFQAPGPFTGDWALGDFAAARNESFKHATGDFIVWIDADDVLIHGENLRKAVEEMERQVSGMSFLPYNYAQDHLGRVFYRQWRERIIRRGVAYWLNPVHEVLMPVTAPGVTPRFDSPVYSHLRKADRKGIAHRNYKILLRQVWQLKSKDPNAQIDPRILFYLGQEARFVEPQKSVGFYEEYLHCSGWPEERAAAHSAIGQMLEYGVLGLPPAQMMAQAEREYAMAAAEMPNNPDGLHGLGRIAHNRSRWHDCINYIERAFAIGNTDTMLGTNPMDRLYRPHVYYNYALAKIGRVDDALKSCKAALEVMPDDPGVPNGAPGMIKCNVGIYEAEIAKREAAKMEQQQQPPAEKHLANFSIHEDIEAPPHPAIKPEALLIWGMQIWKQIVAAGDGARAEAFLRAMPSSIVAHPVMQRMFDSTARRFGGRATISSAWSPIESSAKTGLDVVFFLGGGPEPWDPNTPNQKGLGGSETAAIEMAKNLTKLGHRCVVYAEASGTFDGVEYRHHSTFRGGTSDVFISSRIPSAVGHAGPVNAKLKLLWVHDIHCGPPSVEMERWLLAYDKILCLSEWHKGFFISTYPTIHQDQVLITRNGIDPGRFVGEVAKTNSLVFSSSPNRGLEWLVANFRNAIRPQVPDAELHIFYGFDTWEAFARARGDQAELDSIAQYKSILPPLGTNADGIFNHGKRPQSEVAAAYMQAKVWPYLTTFAETSCITAMEAQAAGCLPVCSRFAALAETVKFGVFVDNADPEAARKYVAAIVNLLTDESVRAPLAESARTYALANLSWFSLANEWSKLFPLLIKAKASDPIPMWKSM